MPPPPVFIKEKTQGSRARTPRASAIPPPTPTFVLGYLRNAPRLNVATHTQHAVRALRNHNEAHAARRRFLPWHLYAKRSTCHRISPLSVALAIGSAIAAGTLAYAVLPIVSPSVLMASPTTIGEEQDMRAKRVRLPPDLSLIHI